MFEDVVRNPKAACIPQNVRVEFDASYHVEVLGLFLVQHTVDECRCHACKQVSMHCESIFLTPKASAC